MRHFIEPLGIINNRQQLCSSRHLSGFYHKSGYHQPFFSLSTLWLATSTDIELLFSHGCLILSHTWSQLSTESTCALLCLGLWSISGLVKDSMWRPLQCWMMWWPKSSLKNLGMCLVGHIKARFELCSMLLIIDIWGTGWWLGTHRFTHAIA